VPDKVRTRALAELIEVYLSEVGDLLKCIAATLWVVLALLVFLTLRKALAGRIPFLTTNRCRLLMHVNQARARPPHTRQHEEARRRAFARYVT
jgi:hypothetical protein